MGMRIMMVLGNEGMKYKKMMELDFSNGDNLGNECMRAWE